MRPTVTSQRFSWAVVLALSFAHLLGCGAPQPSEQEPGLETRPGMLGLFRFCIDPTSNMPGSEEYSLYLNSGETVMIGTCGIEESSAEGDTVLSLHEPGGGLVAFNDDGAAYGCGLASKVDFTASMAGNHGVRVSCAGTTRCCGVVAISRRRGLVAFNVSNTNNATLNTYNKQFKFNAGDVVRLSTCANNAHGASARGDTYLRLFRQSSGLYSEVAANDSGQGCGSAAEIVYVVPATGYYQLRAGCAANTACSGAAAVYVE